MNSPLQKKYKRLAFVVRMSAIGDVIIASHAIAKLQKNGYFTILVSSAFAKDMHTKIKGLDAFICYENKKISSFFIQGKDYSADGFKNYLKNISTLKNPIIFDFQITGRSKKAIRHLKKEFCYPFQTFDVIKRTFYRYFLVFLSFFSFSQNRKKFSSHIISVRDLQNALINKIIKNDCNVILDLEKKEEQTLTYQLPKISLPNDYICLFPGASNFIKMWPKEHFKELVHKILENTNCSVVICGAKPEIFISDYIDYPKNQRVLNLTDKTSLDETLNIIAQAKYIVCNDSFAAHAADAYKKTATVFFGATTPLFGFAPKYEHITIEYDNLACSPCSRHGKSQCRYSNLKCLQGISPESVVKNIIEKRISWKTKT